MSACQVRGISPTTEERVHRKQQELRQAPIASAEVDHNLNITSLCSTSTCHWFSKESCDFFYV